MPRALAETPLATATRHVVEARERIAQQKALVAELMRKWRTTILPEAHRLLAAMRASQKLAEDDLSRLRAESDAEGAPSSRPGASGLGLPLKGKPL